MSYEIKTRKSFDGWEALSEVVIGQTQEGLRLLQLRTSKIRGGIDTAARVFIRQNKGGFYSEITNVFGDFYKYGIAPTKCNRVTEKAVLEVHKFALVHMDDLIKQAKAFYAGQTE